MKYFVFLLSFPQGFNFFDMFMDTKHRKLKVWAEIIPEFIYDCNRPFFETLVPTIDTVRYGYLFEKLLAAGKPVMFTGSTGTHLLCIVFLLLCLKWISIIIRLPLLKFYLQVLAKHA